MNELQLRQYVLDELEYEPSLDAAHIGVAVTDNVVTLTGYVGTYAEKLAAVDSARRIRGVHAIADEIEVRHPSDKKTADDEIAKRALAILNWDALVPASLVKVTVRDGWVTLTGTLNWYYQKTRAEDAVRKLSGVRGIFNNIELKPRVAASDVKRKIEEALKRHAEVEAKAIRISVVDNDKVILEGKVDNWEEKGAVRYAAWAAPGVRSVEDRLTIA